MTRAFVFSSILVAAGTLSSNELAHEMPTPEPDFKANGTELPIVQHHAFKKGEKLSYEVSYGWLDAGVAEIEVKNENKSIDGRDVLHVVGTGTSTGTFNWFFKVRDRYETYMDKKGVFPWIFIRDIHEGGFELKQYYTFNHYEQKVETNKGKVFDAPLGVQDMISSFYYARTLNMKYAQPGQIFEIKAFVDNEVWPLKIKYLRNETIEVDQGTFDCMVFVPVVQTGRIFKDEEDMLVWITRDENKVPILAKASVLVGSITMEITGYHGLANPIARVD